MKIRLFTAILFAFALVFATACGGTVCDKAADITTDQCGIEADGDGDGDGEDVECEGETEELSQCVVDNPDAYCEFLDDPVNNNDNAYTDCVADVTG